MERSFWKNKKVLITGHTGFKGSWLSIWLNDMGAEVVGYSLEPYTQKDNFVLTGIGKRIIDIRGDINDIEHLGEVFEEYSPEIVFHMAAQPLVRLSYSEPEYTYKTNVMGTLNVLEAVRRTDSVKTAVVITTDKCYENKETRRGYKETDAFGGYDPYSSSKACAEILTASYRSSFMNPDKYENHGKSIATVRAGNVIGGGDWARDRIIPDCIRAIEEDVDIKIRSPRAVRPWQHVLDPLCGYLTLAEKMFKEPAKYAEGWNFGPEYTEFSTVWQVVQNIIEAYGTGSAIDVSDKSDLHEAELLYLDITKAKEKLGWKPCWDIKHTIDMTVEWYKNYQKTDVYELCKKQIYSYENKLQLGMNKDL